MIVDCAPATKADIPAMQVLLAELFAQEEEFSPDEKKQRRALELILKDPTRGRLYVARDGKDVVGMASLLYTVSTAEGGKAAWLEDLVVVPEHRGRGVGHALLEYVIEQARAEGILRITLLTDADNTGAQALYRSVGFEVSPMRALRLRFGG